MGKIQNMSIIERLFEYMKQRNLSNYRVEKACGLSNGYLRNLKKAPSFEILEKILAFYPDLNGEWLLKGEGEMLKTQCNVSSSISTALSPSQDGSGIPLVSIDVVAGWNGIDEQGVLLSDCVHYQVPEFITAGAEYLIRVSGSSMYPKYSNGDILACRKIHDVTFFQWGKIYVIDSNQGAMVKRLFPSESNTNVLVCQSDNPKYPPFELPKSEVRSLSIVIGVIRLE